jgi:hypothetical protein
LARTVELSYVKAVHDAGVLAGVSAHNPDCIKRISIIQSLSRAGEHNRDNQQLRGASQEPKNGSFSAVLTCPLVS